MRKPNLFDVEDTIDHIVEVAIDHIVEVARQGAYKDHDQTLTTDKSQYLLAEVYLRRAHDRVMEWLENEKSAQG